MPATTETLSPIRQAHLMALFLTIPDSGLPISGDAIAAHPNYRDALADVTLECVAGSIVAVHTSTATYH